MSNKNTDLDKITQTVQYYFDGMYHSNIYLFYATRFPGQSFKCYNCGISGDTAPGTNSRADHVSAASDAAKAASQRREAS